MTNMIIDIGEKNFAYVIGTNEKILNFNLENIEKKN